MRVVRATSSIVLLLLSAAVLPAAEVPATVPVREHTLANGMRLLMVERRFSPTISAGWVAHAGSVNDPAGATGTAHLLEHMMFKGTRTIGSRDADREAEIMSRIDLLHGQIDQERERLRESRRRGLIDGDIEVSRNATPRLRQLTAEMEILLDTHRPLIIKEEYDQVYSSAGATDINAVTSADYSMYFVTIPSNKMELWFWMESDRLLEPVFRELYIEREVVRQERLSRIGGDPVARIEELFEALFWSSMAYRHPITGWPSDIVTIRRDQARGFFAKYYTPGNITAVLVGDFDTSRATALADAYFGRLPHGAGVTEPVATTEIEQRAERRIHAEAESNPSVQIRWHAVPFVHKDVHALDLLSDLLDGRGGRLHRSLVVELGVAVSEPWAWVQPMRYAGTFEIGAEVADGRTHREVEAALLAQIDRLQRDQVSAAELERAKNHNLVSRFRGLQSNWDLMYALLSADGLGDWRDINAAPAAVRSITPKDLLGAARSHLDASGINVLWVSRRVEPEN